MNKENQKAVKKYKKLLTQAKKLQDSYEKADKKRNALLDARDKAHEKVQKHWNPKVEKADMNAASTYGKVCAARDELKALRKSLIASDNPDRKELIDLILS